MARELDAILDHGEVIHAASCTSEDGSVSFLVQIISPIYETVKAVSFKVINIKKIFYSFLFSLLGIHCFLDPQEAERNNNGKAAHSEWRNYDDFNEYFW